MNTPTHLTLITGASRGIGAATALECARRGMGVILTYKDQREAADTIVHQIAAAGGKAVALRLDVGDIASFEAFGVAVRHALDTTWGAARLQGLVHNAGHGLYSPIEQVTPDQFDSLLNVHLKGPFFLTQILLPLLADGASIVNLTSATTRVATAGVAPYAAAKGALDVLTRYMAKEFGARRIRANAVSPGAIRTDLGGGLNDAFETMLAAQTALGRVGEAGEVASVIASLLGSDLAWVNAQTIEVGGGYQI